MKAVQIFEHSNVELACTKLKKATSTSSFFGSPAFFVGVFIFLQL